MKYFHELKELPNRSNRALTELVRPYAQAQASMLQSRIKGFKSLRKSGSTVFELSTIALANEVGYGLPNNALIIYFDLIVANLRRNGHKVGESYRTMASKYELAIEIGW